MNQFYANVILDSVLNFWTVAGLTYLFIKLFRVKSPQILAWILLLPLLKTGIDLFRYDALRWVGPSVDQLADCINRRTLTICAGKDVHWMGIFPYWQLGIGMFLDLSRSFGCADLLVSQLNVSKHVLALCPFLLSVGPFIWIYKFIHTFSKRRALLASTTTIGTQQGVVIAESPLIVSPLLLGRYILIPPSMADSDLQAVIAHEMHHRRRLDHLSIYLIEGLRSFFWFIPLLNRWMSEWEIQRELSCDLKAIKTEIDPDQYVNVLLHYSEMHLSKNQLPLSAAGKMLKKRCIQLIEYRPISKWVIGLQISSCLFFIWAMLWARFWIF